jgi:GT2 family glycosyltransferase
MSAGPRLSVVVPTWNRRDRLAGLLAALEPLTADGDVEVVIVDDGSTDGTGELLDGVRWATIVRQANGGAASARNAGWHRAAAPVVAFLDDDCLPGPGWPLGLLDAFDRPDVAGVGGAITGIHDGPLDTFVAVERLVDHGRDLDDGVDFLVTANAAYRREVLAAVGGFDQAFPGAAGEDVDLSWRVRASGGRLVRSSAAVRHDHRSSCRQILVTYRGHGRARALLDRRHPDRPSSADAGRALAPSVWRERYQQYRARGVGTATALGLLGLRAASLAAFALGLVEGRRR